MKNLSKSFAGMTTIDTHRFNRRSPKKYRIGEKKATTNHYFVSGKNSKKCDECGKSKYNHWPAARPRRKAATKEGTSTLNIDRSKKLKRTLVATLFNKKMTKEEKLKKIKKIVNTRIGNKKVVDIIERHGGTTALILASMASRDNLEIIKYLVKKGANVNAKDDDGSTALIEACGFGDLEIIKYLVKKGANVNAKDDDNFTVLMMAAKGLSCGPLDDNLETVKFLVKKGANVNAKDGDGVTVLMMASSNCHLEIIKFLVKKGADVNAKDNDGIKAHEYAKVARCFPVAIYLLSLVLTEDQHNGIKYCIEAMKEERLGHYTKAYNLYDKGIELIFRALSRMHGEPKKLLMVRVDRYINRMSQCNRL